MDNLSQKEDYYSRMKSYSVAITFFLLGVFVSTSSTALSQRIGLFSDVRPGFFFTDSVESLASDGIITGYQDGRFGPNDSLTRGQLAVVLQRYDAKRVEPLRQMLSEIIDDLDIDVSVAICGDGIVATEEECDDGNTNNGDGCNSNCTLGEIVTERCSDGHRLGERYRKADGCTICKCTATGPVCSSDECRQRQPLCGNGMCEEGEDDILFCATGCRIQASGRVEGNCNCTLRCEDDCKKEVSCNDQKSALQQYLKDQETRTCTSDSDCTVYQHACPFVTCGVALHQSALQPARERAQFLVNACKREGQVACASCPTQYTAACVRSRCVLEQE